MKSIIKEVSKNCRSYMIDVENVVFLKPDNHRDGMNDAFGYFEMVDHVLALLSGQAPASYIELFKEMATDSYHLRTGSTVGDGEGQNLNSSEMNAEDTLIAQDPGFSLLIQKTLTAIEEYTA